MRKTKFYRKAELDLINGEGGLGFNDVEPGNYKLKVCSDINGDNAWCGSGELVAESEVLRLLEFLQQKLV